MGQAFELFASEYGWSHNVILDTLTPSQFNLYLEMALSRLDDDRRFWEELAVAQGGGDLREFRRTRKTVRQMLSDRKTGKKSKDKEIERKPKTHDEASLTEDKFRQWAALSGIPIYDSTRGDRELISRPHRDK